MNNYRKIFTQFFSKKINKTFILIGIIIFYFLIGRLPYLNTFLSMRIGTFFFLIVLLFLFKPSEKNTVIFASVITGVAIIASLLSANDVLEIYGDIAFFLLFYLMTRYFFKK